MVRRVCLAPHIIDEDPQWQNLFHSKCTIEEKFASLSLIQEVVKTLLPEMSSTNLRYQQNSTLALTNWLGWIRKQISSSLDELSSLIRLEANSKIKFTVM